jgi:uncharacterized protein (TIGR02300 family)
MATNTNKAARGTKRTCQSDDCGARFYDLNNNPIVCPICGSVYELASAPAGIVPQLEEKAPRRPKKPEFEDKTDTADALPEAEGEEDLADVETDDDALPAEGDETFLEEEEEDGGDVSGILGGSVAEDEEEG